MSLIARIMKGFRQVRRDAKSKRRFDIFKADGVAYGLTKSVEQFGLKTVLVTQFTLKKRDGTEVVKIVGYEVNLAEGAAISIYYAKGVRQKNVYPVCIKSSNGFQYEFPTLKEFVVKDTYTKLDLNRLKVSDLDRELALVR